MNVHTVEENHAIVNKEVTDRHVRGKKEIHFARGKPTGYGSLSKQNIFVKAHADLKKHCN